MGGKVYLQPLAVPAGKSACAAPTARQQSGEFGLG